MLAVFRARPERALLVVLLRPLAALVIRPETETGRAILPLPALLPVSALRLIAVPVRVRTVWRLASAVASAAAGLAIAALPLRAMAFAAAVTRTAILRAPI